jgi:hypothetical protein
MSNRKPVRIKPPVTRRPLAESRSPTATRGVVGARPHPRARPTPVTYPTKTSTESIAASIVGLMVLAADSGTSGKVDSTDKNSLEAEAALAKLIAVRFDADD